MIDSRIDVARGVVVHTGRGTVGLQDIFAAMSAAYQNPNFNADYGVVWLLADCDLTVSLTDVSNLSDRVVKVANRARPSGRTAWVTATALGESMIKLLYGQHEWAAEWATFSTFDAAVAWVRGPMAQASAPS